MLAVLSHLGLEPATNPQLFYFNNRHSLHNSHFYPFNFSISFPRVHQRQPQFGIIQYCRYQELYLFPKGNFVFNTQMVFPEPVEFMTRCWLPITNPRDSAVFILIPFNYQSVKCSHSGAGENSCLTKNNPILTQTRSPSHPKNPLVCSWEQILG